jgi:MFS family permease
MGFGTFFIGLLPGYATWGIAAPIVLIALRLVQGLALGGEYGGAAIYVAEHAPANKRGYYTSWIQTTATLGLFMALLVILGLRAYMGEEPFGDWGWRVPFLLSAILLAVSLWIRLKLNESPLFRRMVDEGKQSRRPLSEAFGEWRHCKIAIAALLGATAGEAVIWYGGQFYALFFLTQTLKVPGVTAQIMVAIALVIGTPCFILFGALSDRIGRKPIMLAGFALGAVTYFPIFQGITHFANPKLEAALAAAPVTVTADPGECSFQFKATGTEKYTTGCDNIKAALVNLSVNYTNVAAAPGNQSKRADRRPEHRRRYAGPRRRYRQCREGARLSGRRRSKRHQLSDDSSVARDPGRLRDHGLWPDRRVARRAIPNTDPLQRRLAALSHWQWLVRRFSAGHRFRHRRGHG